MEAKADRILSRTWYIYSRIFQHISQKLSQSDQKLVKTIECLITINKLIEIDFCVCVHCYISLLFRRSPPLKYEIFNRYLAYSRH